MPPVPIPDRIAPAFPDSPEPPMHSLGIHYYPLTLPFLLILLGVPVPGVGIAIPVFYPPAIAAIVALSLSRRYAAPLAYACGSLGTLIGADLMNLGRMRGLGAPVMSIGGAGTFDGIFVVGLMAVLLAAIVSRFNRALSH